jgi:hypothetical protein
MGTGVEDEVMDSESLGALDFDDQGVDRTSPEFAIGTSEVEKVGGVSDGPREPGFLKGGAEEGDVLVREGFGVPLTGAFGEDLDGIKAEIGGGADGEVVTARNREMRSKEGHGGRASREGDGLIHGLIG